MSLFDAFSYAGKRVLVVGGATGMGGAAVDLLKDAGADVVVMDFADVPHDGVTKIHLNLGDLASIDAALDECGGPIDALFACAGVADGTPNVEWINFAGHRHLLERAIAEGLMGAGSAVCFISSSAGLGWENQLSQYKELFATPDAHSAAAWLRENNKADYFHTKQAICAFVAHEAYRLMGRGIRINAICPGPTDTPLAQANKESWLGTGADYREDLGIDASTALDQAYAMVFLNSDAARVISGITMVSDVGYMASGVTGSFPGAILMAQLLHGRAADGVEIPPMDEDGNIITE